VIRLLGAEPAESRWFAIQEYLSFERRVHSKSCREQKTSL
jgi:hypothetical protein